MLDFLPSESLQEYLGLESHEDVLSLLRTVVGFQRILMSSHIDRASKLLVQSPKEDPADCGYMQKALHDALQTPERIEALRIMASRLNELLNGVAP